MPTSKQLGSFSEPNMNLVYVCLVNAINPGNPGIDPTVEPGLSRTSDVIDNVNIEVGNSKDEEITIEVQRSVAVHELVKIGTLDCPEKIEEVPSETIPLPLHDEDDISEDDQNCANPKILSLTKTKWLSDSRDGSPDARVSLVQSSSESSFSENLPGNASADKVLSTVLALDKEHNLFGLSNTYIQVAGRKHWKKPKDTDSKAVFHHTAIVQACYKTCCKRRSNSGLPSSLKYGPCRSKCSSCTSCCSSLCPPSCSASSIAPAPPCSRPCLLPCSPSGPPPPCTYFYSKPCPPLPCRGQPCLSQPCPSYSGCCPPLCKECPRYGLQVSVIKKPKYDPVYNEIEPKSSCILSKPLNARACNHNPCCIPPSPFFPYMMPCFWPARSGAPCSEPARCFHNPPCPRGRTPRGKIHPQELCPDHLPCAGKDKSSKCENLSCIGRHNEALAKALSDYNSVPGPKPASTTK